MIKYLYSILTFFPTYTIKSPTHRIPGPSYNIPRPTSVYSLPTFATLKLNGAEPHPFSRKTDLNEENEDFEKIYLIPHYLKYSKT